MTTDALTPLAQAGLAGVAIALIIALVTIIKYFLDNIKANQNLVTQQHQQFLQSIGANTEVTKQTYEYLKLRNGSGDRLMQELSTKMDTNSKTTQDLVTSVATLTGVVTDRSANK